MLEQSVFIVLIQLRVTNYSCSQHKTRSQKQQNIRLRCKPHIKKKQSIPLLTSQQKLAWLDDYNIYSKLSTNKLPKKKFKKLGVVILEASGPNSSKK